MTLGFKLKFQNGMPTFFPEKILDGLMKNNWIKVNEWHEIMKDSPYGQMAVGSFKHKIHTIREDVHDRWKKDVMIDFFTGVRTKNAYRFAPRVPVLSTQKIEIKEMIMTESSHCYKAKDERVWVVFVDGKKLISCKIIQLAKNDGFDSTEDFFKYFSNGFVGKIIHWTSCRY